MKKMVSEKIPTPKYNLLYRSGNQRYFCADTQIVKTGASIFAVHTLQVASLGKRNKETVVFRCPPINPRSFTRTIYTKVGTAGVEHNRINDIQFLADESRSSGSSSLGFPYFLLGGRQLVVTTVFPLSRST
jgi:hypothetical protein